MLFRGSAPARQPTSDGVRSVPTVWKNPTAAVMHVEEAPGADGWLASIILFEGDLVLLDGRFR